MVSGDGEVDDAFAMTEPALPNFEAHGLPTIAARRGDHRILAEGRTNAQSVPNADTPVRLVSCLDSEAGGDRAERVRGPNIPIVRSEYQDFAGRQLLHRGHDIRFGAKEGSSDLGSLGNAARLCGLSEDVEADLSSELLDVG